MSSAMNRLPLYEREVRHEPNRNASLQFRPRALKVVFSAVLLCLTSGCDFDPQQNVQSPTRPNPATQYDGTLWIAEPLKGSEGTWFWVPWAAAAAVEPQLWPSGGSVDVLEHGKSGESPRRIMAATILPKTVTRRSPPIPT